MTDFGDGNNSNGDDGHESMFQSLTDQAEALSGSIAKLKHLLERMNSAPNAFDNEDQEWVSKWIEYYEQQRSSIQQELNRRQHLYVNTVKRMETALSTRMKVLQSTDQDTGVLEQHPELMQQLVKKQANLTDLLQTMKEKLSAPLDETVAAEDA